MLVMRCVCRGKVRRGEGRGGEGKRGKVTAYVGNGNRSVEGSISEILKHVLNQERALGNEAICGESVYLRQSRRSGAG